MDEVVQSVFLLVPDDGRYLTGGLLDIDSGMLSGFSFLMPQADQDAG